MPDTITSLGAHDAQSRRRAEAGLESLPARIGGDGWALVLGVRSTVGYGLYVFALAVLVLLAAAPLGNTDTYFHLRLGHEFLDGTWSLRDPGSVTTAASADWLPTQWLPEVAMAHLEDWLGLPAVAWLCGLLFVSLATAVYWAGRRQAEPLVAASVTMATLVACATGMSMRPQLVSYLLVVVTAAAWLAARDSGRPPWLLVPLAWLWTMCHGMWPVGIVIGLVAVLGLALDRAHSRATLLRMMAVPVLSAAVSLVTPVGPGLFSAVLSVNSRADYFSEWAPPDFTAYYGVALLAVLAAVVVPRLRGGRRVPWFDVGLLGLATLWAVYSGRTVPVAACLAAPLAARALQSAVAPRPTVHRWEVGFVGGTALAAVVALGLAVPHTSAEPLQTPDWLDETMSAAPVGSTVLSEATLGGYLMWRFPDVDVVAHGYGDMYTDDELEARTAMLHAREGWAELVRDSDVEYAVLSTDSPLAYNLRELEGWTVKHDSGGLQLLEPPSGSPTV